MPDDAGDGSANDGDVNRLIALGLSFPKALAVAGGELDETIEVARAQERRNVAAWFRGIKNIPTDLTPVWDLNSANFYLAFDGGSPGDHASTEFALIYADVDDVNSKLTSASSREKGPWNQRYKGKSCGVAYRWLHGHGVTPPLLRKFKVQIHIIGGMHRFHLAKHYGTTRMPFLVSSSERSVVMNLLPSATRSGGSDL